jgi:hypothetical protein
MDVIEGGANPDAHKNRRILPQCDICGIALRGPMPKPYWVAPSATAPDEHGNPKMEESTVRVYLCKDHRQSMRDALDNAYRRERDRQLAGQRMFPGSPGLRPLD